MRDIRKCNYCEQSIDCSRAGYRTLNGHLSNCSKNPKFLSRKKKIGDKLRKRVERNSVCLKCKTIYTYITTERGYEKKYCSRKCANSKEWSEDVNRKRSITIRNTKGIGGEYDPTKSLHRKKTIERRRAGIFLKEKRVERIKVNCFNCGKSIEVLKNKAGIIKYCNGTCRNKINNKIIKGTRSKGEILLESKIRLVFPDLVLLTNDRSTLDDNLEPDLYLPSLRLGIEWNGIFHYVDIHGKGFLKKRQEADSRKLKIAKEKNIEIFIVKDLTSSKRDINLHIDHVIEKIRSLNIAGDVPDL